MRAMDGVMSEVQEEEPGTSHYLPTPPTSPRSSFFPLFLKCIPNSLETFIPNPLDPDELSNDFYSLAMILGPLIVCVSIIMFYICNKF